MSDKTPSAGESVLAAAAGQTQQQTTPPATPAATPPANPPADQQQTGDSTDQQTGSSEQRVPLDRFQTVTSEKRSCARRSPPTSRRRQNASEQP